MNTILVKQIKSKFIEKYHSNPLMVFSPGRINLIGEHTDYNEGFVFPAAIDKGIITAIQKSSSAFCTLFAIDKNENYSFYLNDIQPVVNGGWQNYILGVIDEIQKKGLTLNPFDIVFGGDIPIGAGLSSSAALENSIVFGLNELFQLGLSKREMIFISQQAEHHFVGLKCGIMDMYAGMFGEENRLLLLDCRIVESEPCRVDFKDYELLLINTNVKHSLSESAYNDRRIICEKIAGMLGKKALRDVSKEDLFAIKDKISEDDYQKTLYVIQEIERTQEAANALKNNNLLKLGELIYASHQGLQYQYKVSCSELDFLVDEARENKGVIGARMMGGGFGGCTINVVAKSETKKFTEKTAEKYQAKFHIACSFYQVRLSQGVHIIDIEKHIEPQNIYIL